MLQNPMDFLEEKLAKKANLCESCKSAVDSVQVEKFWSISGERVPPVSRQGQSYRYPFGSDDVDFALKRHQLVPFFQALVLCWCS